MRITHDEKYIYADGSRVAVFTEGHAHHSLLQQFIDYVDGEFEDKEECTHEDEVKCKHCGHLTPTNPKDKTPDAG